MEKSKETGKERSDREKRIPDNPFDIPMKQLIDGKEKREKLSMKQPIDSKEQEVNKEQEYVKVEIAKNQQPFLYPSNY